MLWYSEKNLSGDRFFSLLSHIKTILCYNIEKNMSDDSFFSMEESYEDRKEYIYTTAD